MLRTNVHVWDSVVKIVYIYIYILVTNSTMANNFRISFRGKLYMKCHSGNVYGLTGEAMRAIISIWKVDLKS